MLMPGKGLLSYYVFTDKITIKEECQYCSALQ